MQFLEALRSRLDEGNFRPFTIHLMDGRAFRVPHQDFVAITSQVIVIADEIGLRHTFEADQIVELSESCEFSKVRV